MSGTYPGIDYSGPGSTTNRDPSTGIRYGVISQNSLDPYALSDLWDQARDLSYEAAVEDAKHRIILALDGENPRTALGLVLRDFLRGERAVELGDFIFELDDDPRHINREAAWEIVEQDFNDSYECDQRDWLYELDDYRVENCLISDVIVLKSPYYTFAQFCSPCVPGAANLNSPYNGSDVPSEEDSKRWETFKYFAENVHGFPKAYCFDHDWFENNQAPYPVFSVETGKIVLPTE